MSHESAAHYNIEPDFFETFLDPYLKYTSGYFVSHDENLENATRRMLDLIIERGSPTPSSRILEIGPGWGSLIKRLDEKQILGRLDYQGISPSQVQNKYIQTKYPQISPIHCATFENFDVDEKFDIIFLIGSFCHLKDKTRQLKRMVDLLNPAGRVVIEDSFFLTQDLFEKHANHPQTKYVQKEVFGWSEIPSLSKFIEDAHHCHFKIVSIEENTQSYKKTITHWLNKLLNLDEKIYPQTPNFIQYLGIAQKSWDYTIGNYLISLEKRS